jgi:hypothetical protein
LNKIRKPTTAGEITELLKGDLDQGDRPSMEKTPQTGCKMPIIEKPVKQEISLLAVKMAIIIIRPDRVAMWDSGLAGATIVSEILKTFYLPATLPVLTSSAA